MKKIILAAASLSVLTFPIHSMANDDSFYLKANIGVGMTLNSDIDNLFSSGDSAKMTFDSGFVGSFAAGYDFANPLRVELEIIGQKNDLDITSYNNQYSSFNEGDLKTRSIMFNGFYDIDTGSAWTPFAGIGMGWGRVVINPGLTVPIVTMCLHTNLLVVFPMRSMSNGRWMGSTVLWEVVMPRLMTQILM
jgi:opacity protein-like surface antigen